MFYAPRNASSLTSVTPPPAENPPTETFDVVPLELTVSFFLERPLKGSCEFLTVLLDFAILSNLAVILFRGNFTLECMFYPNLT